MGFLWDKVTFGRARRARRMMRRLRELDRQDAWSAPELRPAGRGGGRLSRLWSTGGISVLVVAGLLAAVYFTPALRGAGTDLRGSGALPGDLERPPPGVGEARDVRGQPPGDAPTGPHEFFERQGVNRTPVAWDPCRQIHYVTSGAAPLGAERIVAEAIQELSKATGLQFVDDGFTGEMPGPQHRPIYLPERYGKTWAPVLVAWTTPEAIPDLAGSVAGRGGPSGAATETGVQVWVSGTVFLDRPQLTRPRTAEGRAQVRGVVLHEFGHLLGLAHVEDPTQLMNPEAVAGIDDLQAGDREGLAKLGRGSCAPGL